MSRKSCVNRFYQNILLIVINNIEIYYVISRTSLTVYRLDSE